MRVRFAWYGIIRRQQIPPKISAV